MARCPHRVPLEIKASPFIFTGLSDDVGDDVSELNIDFLQYENLSISTPANVFVKDLALSINGLASVLSSLISKGHESQADEILRLI